MGSRAENIQSMPCDSQHFNNVYYLVEPEKVTGVSLFFKNLFNDDFENIEPFTSRVGNRNRIVNYYDTRLTSIMNTGHELYHTKDENLPDYRSGREKIIYRENKSSPGFNSSYEVRRYNKKATALDKHPLFGKIRRKERYLLLDQLKQLDDFELSSLTRHMTVEHEELVFLVSHFSSHTAAVILDKFHISNFGLPNTHTLLKFEIYPDQMKQLVAQEVYGLNRAMCNLTQQFQEKFPSIKPLNTFGYQQYIHLANLQLPSRIYFQRYPWLFTLGQILVLLFIGFLILYLLLGRYKHAKHYRQVSLEKNNY